jgi:ATP-binding cassette subfamily C (CFTR/MRP) protein 1
MDDPLSAVDAYVGKSILDSCLLTGPLSTRTRVLVTHSLGLLEKTDRVYVMESGAIREEGAYQDLMQRDTLFSRLIEEYGNLEDPNTTAASGARPDRPGATPAEKTDTIDPKTQADLMQEEERETGSVSWSVYSRYLKHAGGLVWFPINVGLLILTQSITVGTNVFLGIWTSNGVPGFTQSQYIAVYVGLGAAQTASVFFSTWAFFFMCLRAGLSLFRDALAGVLGSPISMFDTTPMGRIISRLSKDQDTLDTQLSSTMFSFLFTTATVFGTVFLVFYTFPLLGIIFAPMVVLYYASLTYYRKSSVEVKRLDSLTRSQLYASYSETLTGLSTIRAYNMQASSIMTAEKGLDMENKAYYMTVAIQRWLAIRLDLFGNFLILGIGLFAAGYRYSVDPSKIGVVLTYALSITQILSEMISQFAQNEQNMNAVERVLVYIDLPPEGARTTKEDPPQEWPQHGAIEFRNVELAYREGLPLVLKDVSFAVGKGEKIGVVGRTGAGKSSLLQALFRAVELRQGSIIIDGVDIAQIGLDTLRSRLALVPQDTTLFLGTLRENIDPMKTRADAELISVLQRCWLLPGGSESGTETSAAKKDPVAEAKFDLDATVGDEGSNYSAGEKQLLALARALVKNSRIIVLDEATSSVDVETDAKVQRTIQTQFSSSTLICIAHRLNTIAYYDRVLVMDSGTVAEFDTVLNLFDNEASIFRSLCDEAGLSRADILRIRSQNHLHTEGDSS